jgi:membrane protease YdiL (CAAX protease family)
MVKPLRRGARAASVRAMAQTLRPLYRRRLIAAGLGVAVYVAGSFGLAAVSRAPAGDAPVMGELVTMAGALAPFALALAVMTWVSAPARAAGRWGEVARGAFVWSLCLLAPALGLALFSAAPPAPFGWFAAWSARDIVLLLAAGVVLFAIQTRAEEMLFRGLLLQEALARGLSRAASIAATSALFAAIHWSGQWDIVAFAGLSGAVFALVTLARGDFAAAWGAHWAQNVAAGVLLFGPFGAPDTALALSDWLVAIAGLCAFTAWAVLTRPGAARSDPA